MSFDQADYVRVQKLRKKERDRLKIPSLDILTQAAVKAEHVTGHGAWDTFLSYVQSAIEKSRIHLDRLDAALTDPLVVSHDHLMQIKIERAQVAARIEAWDAAVSLPKQIMEAGEQAENALLSLVDKEQNERAA